MEPHEEGQEAPVWRETVRVAMDLEPGIELGMVLERSTEGGAVTVGHIYPHGAMHEWNASHPEEEQVFVGDLLQTVNGLKPYMQDVVNCFRTLGEIELIFRRCGTRVATFASNPNRHLAPAYLMEHLPRVVSTDDDDTCAICLTTMMEECGDEVVMLPCHHIFHSKCARTWLTLRSRQCPLCKKALYYSEIEALVLEENAKRRPTTCKSGVSSVQGAVRKDFGRCQTC